MSEYEHLHIIAKHRKTCRVSINTFICECEQMRIFAKHVSRVSINTVICECEQMRIFAKHVSLQYKYSTVQYYDLFAHMSICTYSQD